MDDAAYLLSVKKFAVEAHKDQFRKYTGQRYIVHPAAVAKRVSKVEGCNVHMVAAAWLHDVVEDTDWTLQDIVAKFGYITAIFVSGMTDSLTPEDGNRAFRKAAYREQLRLSLPPVQTIKLADIQDNTKSIVKYDPNFAKIYMKEQQKMLEVLTLGDEVLYDEVKTIIDDYFKGK